MGGASDASGRMRTFGAMVPVIPVLVIEDAGDAVPLAEALVDGGLAVLEVTLRTPAALDAIKAMSDVPGAIVGAGTLLTARDTQSAKDAGAKFGVSPGATDALLQSSLDYDLPLLPGAATASEIMALRKKGYDFQKFFPAEASGGINALNGFAGPFQDVTFCPTGGISEKAAIRYLSLNNVTCIGGTWIAPKDHMKRKDWAGMRDLAFKARTLPK